MSILQIKCDDIAVNNKFNKTFHKIIADETNKNYILTYEFYNDLLKTNIQADVYRASNKNMKQGYLLTQFSIDNKYIPCLLTKLPVIVHISSTIQQLADKNALFTKANIYKEFEKIFNWRVQSEKYLQDKQYKIIKIDRCIIKNCFIPKVVLEYQYENNQLQVKDYISGDTYKYIRTEQKDDFFNQYEFVEFMFLIETYFAFSAYEIYFEQFRQLILSKFRVLKEKYPLLNIGFVQKNFNMYLLLNNEKEIKLLLNNEISCYNNIKVYFTYPEHEFMIHTIVPNEKLNFVTFNKNLLR